MEVPLRFARNGDEEIKAANYPEIRFFTVSGHPAYHHTDVVDGTWKVVSPETAVGSRQSRTISRARSSRRSMFRSAWSWMPSAELPRKLGPALTRFARSWTSIFR